VHRPAGSAPQARLPPRRAARRPDPPMNPIADVPTCRRPPFSTSTVPEVGGRPRGTRPRGRRPAHPPRQAPIMTTHASGIPRLLRGVMTSSATARSAAIPGLRSSSRDQGCKSPASFEFIRHGARADMGSTCAPLLIAVRRPNSPGALPHPSPSQEPRSLAEAVAWAPQAVTVEVVTGERAPVQRG
jgi:hypothetical protein